MKRFLAALTAVLVCFVCAVPALGVVIRGDEIFDEPDPANAPTTQFDALPPLDTSLLPVDFAQLQSENPDIYGWISIPDTQIDFPLLQSPEGDDPDYYLDYTVDGVYGYPGSIYTENLYNTRKMTDRVTVIYGHNMSNGDAFGTLKLYHDDAYRQEHSLIYVYTPERIFTYEIVFCVTYDNRLILSWYDCNRPEGYEAFIQSLYDVGTDPMWISEDEDFSAIEHMIVLSTCNGDHSERYVIGAKMVDVQ